MFKRGLKVGLIGLTMFWQTSQRRGQSYCVERSVIITHIKIYHRNWATVQQCFACPRSIPQLTCVCLCNSRSFPQQGTSLSRHSAMGSGDHLQHQQPLFPQPHSRGDPRTGGQLWQLHVGVLQCICVWPKYLIGGCWTSGIWASSVSICSDKSVLNQIMWYN